MLAYKDKIVWGIILVMFIVIVILLINNITLKNEQKRDIIVQQEKELQEQKLKEAIEAKKQEFLLAYNERLKVFESERSDLLEDFNDKVSTLRQSNNELNQDDLKEALQNYNFELANKLLNKVEENYTDEIKEIQWKLKLVYKEINNLNIQIENINNWIFPEEEIEKKEESAVKENTNIDSDLPEWVVPVFVDIDLNNLNKN